MRAAPQRLASALASFLVLTLIAIPARGEGWSSELSLYLFATGLSGHTGIGDSEIEVDQSFSDIVDSLEFGAMAGFSATNGQWTVLADAVLANIGVAGGTAGGFVSADLDVDTTILEVDFGYQVSRPVLLFAGARAVDLSSSIDLRVVNQELHAEGSKSWVDPVVGLRWRSTGESRWQSAVRGDIGGFGVGSDRTWNAVGTVSYRASDRIRVGAGYRILDIDYDDGSGPDRFRFDIRMEGPVVGLGISF